MDKKQAIAERREMKAGLLDIRAQIARLKERESAHETIIAKLDQTIQAKDN